MEENTSMLDLTGISLPFTVNDMATAGMTLLGLVAGFVLLALAFKFVPKIITLILGAFRGGNKA
ncbi:hypothetical protein [Cytobacillus gottheilii]|uniref:hypothetical protein n=1 Tax=Cytobacillus gottheilii TaxID=859144 RepID=UPI00083165B3|nr:hypothetical protein [Cytobacillus gottheilii]